MLKSITPLLVFCILNKTGMTQKVFYSETEREQYDLSQTHIVGKVKNKIVILKYPVNREKIDMLIYDYNMHLKKTVPMNSFLPGRFSRIDFVNRDSAFDAIIQYYTLKNYYCKAARFNEQGELVQRIVTIDSVTRTDQSEDETFDLVESEDKKQIILMRAYTGVKPGCLQLDYFFLDPDLKSNAKKQYLIPFNSSIRLSPFYLDNSGNLLFAEFTPGDTSRNRNAIVIYKIPRYNDSAVNSVQYIDDNYPVDLIITIENSKRQYLVNGIFLKAIGSDSLQGPTHAQSLYSCLFNEDLLVNGKDISVPLRQMRGADAMAQSSTFYFNNVLHGNDSGYYVACATPAIPAFSPNSDLAFEEYKSDFINPGPAGSSSPFYMQPNNNDAIRLNPATPDRPTNPVYYNPATPARQNSIIDFPGNDTEPGSYTKRTANKGKQTSQAVLLFVMHLNNNNEMQWQRLLNGNIENDNSIINSVSPAINTKSLHFIFSHFIGKNKKTAGEITISKKGDFSTKAVISSDLLYEIQIEKGVQIDDRSIVFPCKSRDRLAFAKVEFD